jgi:RimJ/RimL family protein N-acetyltransferase
LTDSVTIRHAEPADLGAFYDVLEAVAAEGRWIGTEVPFDRDARSKKTEAAMLEGTDAYLVAEIDGRIVGTLGIHQVIPGLYDIGMMILEQWRGHGIGTQLMNVCLREAKERNAYKLTLQVWPHNAPAIALYERFGFEREGYLKKQWRRNNGELWDAVVMGLILE